MKIVIVGNGFDLAHGLKTSFKEFTSSNYTFLSDCMSASVSVYEWNEFEVWINNYLREEAIIDTYTDINKKIKYDVISELKKFKSEFCKYLSFIDIDSLELKNNIQKKILDSDYILNFNYTDTIHLYKFSGKNIHIHGHMNDLDRIIIGQSEDSRTNIEISRILVEVDKHAQLYSDENYQDYFEIFDMIFNNEFENLEIVNIGFSFGKSDELFTKLLKERIEKIDKVCLSNFEYLKNETKLICEKLNIEKYNILEY